MIPPLCLLVGPAEEDIFGATGLASAKGHQAENKRKLASEPRRRRCPFVRTLEDGRNQAGHPGRVLSCNISRWVAAGWHVSILVCNLRETRPVLGVEKLQYVPG